MTIQFICRGNVFRSIIAEAYLASFHLPQLDVLSSGTKASQYRELNADNAARTKALLARHGLGAFIKHVIGEDLTQDGINHSDLLVFMNQKAFNEANKSFKLPPRSVVWRVNDIAEQSNSMLGLEDRERVREAVYQQIISQVDKLVEVYVLKKLE